jgi:aryl-alcohol dehydrogenase-like predicted oxidoreductase
MERFMTVSELHTVQSPYNLFEREIDRDVLPYLRKKNLSALAYGSLCRGLLTGKMRSDTKFAGDDLRKSDPKFQPTRYPQYLNAVGQLDDLARKRYGKHVMDLAVRWVLDQPGITSALWGARHPAQLEAVTGALGWNLEAEGSAAIDQILRQAIANPVGPEFMAPPEGNTAASA